MQDTSTDITGGYIFKADRGEIMWVDYTSNSIPVNYMTVHPKAESITQEQKEYRCIEHIENLLAQQAVKNLHQCVHHETAVKAQIVMPLADHNITQRVDGFKRTEAEDIMPVIATHG